MIRFVTQRRWWYCGVLLARRFRPVRRRVFLARWDAAHGLVSTAVFWIQSPCLWLEVRRLRRLYAMGRTEVEL